jgi:two-component system copper resistance phosphate regulon response regulator CusR
MNLLVIEDELKTAEALNKGLKESGYTVDVAHEGAAGLALARKNTYQLIISDIVMPKLNGIALCEQIRAGQPNTPILLLTALSSKSDVVKGLNAGADDYLTKPFDFSELLARIRVLTRRIDSGPPVSANLSFSDLHINLKTTEVNRLGVRIDLTAKEFKLLEYFLRRPNMVISRSDLARDIWNLDFNTGTNIVEVYISYLRNKIDKPFEKKLLHNIHGMGYILRENQT